MTQRKAARRVEAWRLCTRKHWHQLETLNEFDATCIQCAANESALRAARASGFREGQERMRERCAHLVWQIAKDFGFGLPMVCDAIRALPLEVDDV